ncbi:MAG: hypothetical protein ACI8WB_004673 [Phenylobacterium sp.]|jgi:uncharacterized protein YcgL (UPF0745 family)
MLCTIYRSSNKADTYLYIEKRDDFSSVPKALLETFGRPELVMTINLGGKQKLALADIDKVKTQLQSNGFYLQLPPPPENLLDVHKEAKEANKAP